MVDALTDLGPDASWLDFGCGTGGLVEYIRENVGCAAFGYERGWAADQLAIPVLDDGALDKHAGTFDVVTAIEVIEHTVEPVDFLRRLRTLLRPGGLLFLTTGNSQPYRHKLERWRYVVPEIHLSFFEPSTLALALQAAEFQPVWPGWSPGYVDILRFKILKNLRIKRRSPIEAVMPWRLLARMADARVQLSAHPVGVADCVN